MGLLDILAGIGGGLEGGGKAAAELERRKRERAEEVRQQAEFDQANADRTGLRQAMHGIYDDTKRDTADENATMVEAAGEGMDRLMPERSYGDIQLPFAGVMKKGAEAVRTEGAKPSQFDPNVPYDKLVAIQSQRRDTNARIVDRRTTQNRLRDQFDLNTRKADEATAAAARTRGDVETGRAMLLRLAQQKDPRILYTEEEIKGLSPEAVDKLTEQFGKGTLNTGDFRDRQTIRVEMPVPRAGGSTKATKDGITIGDLNTAITQQTKQVDDVWERAPVAIQAFGRMRYEDLAKKLTGEQGMDPDIAAWMLDLMQAEKAGRTATTRRNDLMRDDLHRAPASGTGARSTPLPAGRATAPAPPSSGPTPAQRKQYLDLIDQDKQEEAAAFFARIRGG
jgi:hypothetical protein